MFLMIKLALVRPSFMDFTMLESVIDDFKNDVSWSAAENGRPVDARKMDASISALRVLSTWAAGDDDEADDDGSEDDEAEDNEVDLVSWEFCRKTPWNSVHFFSFRTMKYLQCC